MIAMILALEYHPVMVNFEAHCELVTTIDLGGHLLLRAEVIEPEKIMDLLVVMTTTMAASAAEAGRDLRMVEERTVDTVRGA